MALQYPLSGTDALAPASRSSRKALVEFSWATIAVIVTLVLIGFPGIDYTRPLALSGDHLFVLVHARAMREGVGFWSNPYLGFPFGQYTYLFPQFEPGLKLIVWVIAHLGIGPFIAVKLYYAVGVSLITASAYWAMRMFNVQRWIACVLSAIYMLCPYFEIRALGHDYLAIFLAAPFGAGIAAMIATLDTRRQLLDFIRTPFFLIGTLVVASCGLYYAFFSMLFIAAACLALSIRIRSIVPILLAGSMSVFVLACLIIGAFGPGLGMLLNGEIRAPSRSALEQLYHGLTISDSILGLAGVDVFRRAVEDYQQIRVAKLGGEGGNEWPCIPLVLVIIASPFIVLVSSSARKSNASYVAIAASAALIVLGVMFATRGGIGFLFNELISPMFRGQTRILPFLSFFAVLIVAIACSEMNRSPSWWLKICGIVVLAGVAFGDRGSIWELVRAQDFRLKFPDAIAAEHSVPAMLVSKNQAGLKSIFQLPVQIWPESSPRNGFEFQNHQLPFVYDRISPPSNWSYGSALGQRGADEQRAAIDETRPSSIPGTVAGMGFDGILVEKAAYTATELASLEAGLLASNTKSCRIFNDPNRALYSLRCP